MISKKLDDPNKFWLAYDALMVFTQYMLIFYFEWHKNGTIKLSSLPFLVIWTGLVPYVGVQRYRCSFTLSVKSSVGFHFVDGLVSSFSLFLLHSKHSKPFPVRCCSRADLQLCRKCQLEKVSWQI